MKLQNAIARCKNMTGSEPSFDGNVYRCEYKGHEITFFENGKGSGQAINFYEKRIGLEDDHTTDYFAGTFWDNLKQCFDAVDRWVESHQEDSEASSSNDRRNGAMPAAGDPPSGMIQDLQAEKVGTVGLQIGDVTHRVFIGEQISGFIAATRIAGSVWYETAGTGIGALLSLQSRLAGRSF